MKMPGVNCFFVFFFFVFFFLGGGGVSVFAILGKGWGGWLCGSFGRGEEWFNGISDLHRLASLMDILE